MRTPCVAVRLVGLFLSLSGFVAPVTAKDGACLPDQPDEGNLGLKYGDVHVAYNQQMTLSNVSSAPSVTAVSEDTDDVLLLMLDPDAPSPASCPRSYWLHWMAQGRLQEGKFVVEQTDVEYSPPAPPPGTGLHRYQFLLLRLQGDQAVASGPPSRQGFDLQAFQTSFHLVTLASYQFRAQKALR